MGAIGSLTVKDSPITSAQVGHDIKSRAASRTITGNTITDGSTGTASYEVDLTNGGVGDIENNYIKKGANAQNPIAIASGEDGNVYANSSLTVEGNTIVNDYTTHNTTAVVNRTGATANVSGNELYGWTSVASGPSNVGGNTTTTTKPAQGSQPISSTTPTSSVVSAPPQDTVSSTASVDTATPAATADSAAVVAPDAGGTVDVSIGSAPISPDTMASPVMLDFIAAAAGSNSQQGTVDSSAPMPVLDATMQAPADYTDPASIPADPAAVSMDWGMVPDQTSGTETSQYWSGHDQSGGAVAAMATYDTTVRTSMQGA